MAVILRNPPVLVSGRRDDTQSKKSSVGLSPIKLARRRTGESDALLGSERQSDSVSATFAGYSSCR
jgi:hypothetical protein